MRIFFRQSHLYLFYCICHNYRGDILKVVEDVIALRPTIFCAVPRLYTRIHDKVNKQSSLLHTCTKIIILGFVLAARDLTGLMIHYSGILYVTYLVQSTRVL